MVEEVYYLLAPWNPRRTGGEGAGVVADAVPSARAMRNNSCGSAAQPLPVAEQVTLELARKVR